MAPTVTQATPPPPKEEAPAPTAALKLGDVKRFADREKKAEGVVKVLEADEKGRLRLSMKAAQQEAQQREPQQQNEVQTVQ